MKKPDQEATCQRKASAKQQRPTRMTDKPAEPSAPPCLPIAIVAKYIVDIATAPCSCSSSGTTVIRPCDEEGQVQPKSKRSGVSPVEILPVIRFHLL